MLDPDVNNTITIKKSADAEYFDYWYHNKLNRPTILFGFEWHIIDTVSVGVKIIVQVLNIKLIEDLLSR